MPEKVYIQLYSNDIDGDKIYAQHTKFENNEPIACIGKNPNYTIRLLRNIYIARILRKMQLTLKYLMSEKEAELRINNHIESAAIIESESQFCKSILLIKALLEAHNIEYYFFAIPSKYACISGDWESANFVKNTNRFFQENNIPFININNSFQEHANPTSLFYKKDIHCNERGNLIIAKTLINTLQ